MLDDQLKIAARLVETHPDTREDLQLFLIELWEEQQMTVFFITHDLEEAGIKFETGLFDIVFVDALPLTEGDIKGDLYEYLLSKLTTAGINGQCRTPRHIIDTMIAMEPERVISEALANQNACCAGAAATAIETAKHLGADHADELRRAAREAG